MKYSSIAYLTKQGWKNMLHNRLMTLASVGILAACLFITGCTALLGVNINRFTTYLAGQNEVVVYLLDDLAGKNGPAEPDTAAESAAEDVSEEDPFAAAEELPAEELPAEDGQTSTAVNIEAAVAVIEGIDNVESYVYVSPEEALEEAIGWMEGYADLLEGYREDNPMPASFRIRLKDLSQLETTVKQLQRIKGVEYIKSPNDMADIMVTLQNAVKWIAVGLVAILSFVCIVVVSNTIRLTVFARRREINIMKYVGATNTFIRFPFFVEGMTSGLLAGLLAFAAISVGYIQLLEYLATHPGNFTWLNNALFSVAKYETVRVPLLISFMIAGVILGGLGTAGSVRKYLKV